jgi:hypothetical protein
MKKYSKEKEENNNDQSKINEMENRKQFLKSIKSKSWFFRVINKMAKPLARLMKKKKREQERRHELPK